MSDYLLGIDLGGTKIEAALVPVDSPTEPVCRLRVPTGQELGYGHIVEQIATLCRRVGDESGLPLPSRIGMGHPGTTDPATGKIKCSNTQCLNGQPLHADLEAATGRIFFMENDANCFAVAEALHGAARGAEVVFGIIFGTGVGGGIVVHGRVLHGCHGIAGEWGQIILDPNGPESVYGTKGTIEAFLSGPGLERFYVRQGGEAGRRLPEIVARAREGIDPAASATLNSLTTRFVQAVTLVVNSLDPHAIVIGGGVGNIDELYSPEVRQAIGESIFQSSPFAARLLRPELGDSAGVFGAALLTR